MDAMHNKIPFPPNRITDKVSRVPKENPIHVRYPVITVFPNTVKENRIRIAKDYATQILNEEEYDILRQQFEIELAQAVEKLERLEKQRSKFNRLFTVDSWISELRQYSSSKKLSASMLNAFVKCVRVYADNRIEIEWKHKDAITEYLELVNGGVGLVG